MQYGIEAALGRVAIVLRLLGAIWVVLLVATSAVAGQLTAPLPSMLITLAAVLWAVTAWRAGWIVAARRHGRIVLGADLSMAVVVLVGPGLFGETVGFGGGYPFAALLVAVAAAGRQGVVVAAGVLITATLVNLFSVGTPSLSFVTSSILLYGLGAAALVLGIEVIERQEHRARAAESALVVARERDAMASHLHDSVLQTLALVQRRADEPDAVRSLARGQERELRDWLFGVGDGGVDPLNPGSDGVQRLGAALEIQAEDVQERYGVSVAVVIVGGAAALPVVDNVPELVLAAREAMANAAVHAGVDRVDVFAQRDGSSVAVFIRDRGPGFDPGAVPTDRHGVRGSIVGRMSRAGGIANIVSSSGRGTEVELRLDVGRVAGNGREDRT